MKKSISATFFVLLFAFSSELRADSYSKSSCYFKESCTCVTPKKTCGIFNIGSTPVVICDVQPLYSSNYFLNSKYSKFNNYSFKKNYYFKNKKFSKKLFKRLRYSKFKKNKKFAKKIRFKKFKKFKKFKNKS